MKVPKAATKRNHRDGKQGHPEARKSVDHTALFGNHQRRRGDQVDREHLLLMLRGVLRRWGFTPS